MVFICVEVYRSNNALLLNVSFAGVICKVNGIRTKKFKHLYEIIPSLSWRLTLNWSCRKQLYVFRKLVVFNIFLKNIFRNVGWFTRGTEELLFSGGWWADVMLLAQCVEAYTLYTLWPIKPIQCQRLCEWTLTGAQTSHVQHPKSSVGAVTITSTTQRRVCVCSVWEFCPIAA